MIKKILKIIFLWIYLSTYRLMVIQILYNFIIVLILHQRPLNYTHCKLYKILMVLDGVLNDNKII
jgi:hypothetical protein